MNYSMLIAPVVGVAEKGVAATIALLDEKATIPFIARYRKERTGSLDEVQIAAIAEQYAKFQEMSERKETILKTIEEQGKLTEELKKRIEACWNATELEDIYLPYKPHKKTRADIAREKGLEPLAELLMKQRPEKLTASEEELQGARDIIAEWIAQDERARGAIRREFSFSAVLKTKKVESGKLKVERSLEVESGKLKGESDSVEALNYKDYFNVSEPLKRISSHRLLAIRRAEKEGFIRVDISADQEKCLDKLGYLFLRARNDASYQVELAMEDSYKRLLKPSIETEFANMSKEKADQEAIRVFAENLKQLLLDSPLGQKRVLALDPGWRTGCKMVMLSAQGDLLAHDVVMIRMSESAEKIRKWVEEWKPEAIAIGNGTASRECEAFVRASLVESGKLKVERSLEVESGKWEGDVPIYMVSEAGASVYSASKIGREEFPKEDVTVRGAVSIGRRLMDPLAELVKIDPKSIGVGQYQHDVDQVKLRDMLNQTVEHVVNYVGVDVNTASPYLLTYISGLGPSLAQNIVAYRKENGPYKNRKALMKVPKMGAKTFEQCAGFLRISDGDEPLDNTAVHPESYKVAAQIRKAKEALKEGETLDLRQFVTEEVGLPTLTDIARELEKPSRDPRQQAEVFAFAESVHTIEDVQEGMVLPGIVTNLAAFGAFVDLGVHKDGLIHISEMADRRINSPSEVVLLHQHVQVRVIEVDRVRGRIQLSLKGV